MPLTQYSGPWGIKQAAHLLRRATCGATKQQIQTFAGLNVNAAVDNLMHTALPDPVLPVDPLTGQEWVLSGTTGASSEPEELLRYFKGWFIGQMMTSGINDAIAPAYSAREKIVLFLHTHFTAIQSKISESRYLYFQNQLFRLFSRDALSPDPLVNFKELTVKVSVDNAMLRLLDGSQNRKGSVNENYARELLELYTIGRGLEGNVPPTPIEGEYNNYTEADIQVAARILSGWQDDIDFQTLDPDTNLYRGKVRGSALNASAHDNDIDPPKTFSTKFIEITPGSRTITPDPLLLNNGNPTEESALDEIRKMINLIYDQEETARHICRKIYRFFVYAAHTPEDNLALENTVIAEMANTFRNSGYRLHAVIDELLRSDHFYDAGNGVTDDNFGGIIKSPLDLILGTFRMFDYKLPDMTTQPAEFYTATDEILQRMQSLGMDFYEPYDVAGYDAYHQFPIYHRFWITPNSLANRYEFARTFVTFGETGMFKTNVLTFVQNNFGGVAANSRQLILEVIRYFLPVSDNLSFDPLPDPDPDPNDNSALTAERLNYFKARFLQELAGDPEAYWTQRWNEGAGDLRVQLEFLFNALLQSPEYQLA